MSNIKICVNCGDILLEQAKKCPTCGKKELLLVDKNENEIIQEVKSNAPNPKGLKPAKWETNSKSKPHTENNIACCPKCGSTSLSANKKGFSVGKAIVGDIVASPAVGLVAGLIGKNKVIVTCLKCGHQWKAGK